MEIKEVLSDAIFKDIDLPQPPPIITIGGKIVATAGNFITINGLPKSRKTTFAFFCIAAALRRSPLFDISVNLNPNEKIVLVDTEQGIHDFSKQIKTLKQLCKAKKLPVQFDAYLFRKYEPNVILTSIYEIMLTQKPKILIIDNLTELVINPNDMAESKAVIQFLKRITQEFDCVVVCLLHLTKNSLMSIGNLGSYADRGAQSVLKVTLDRDTQASTLDATLMRSDLYFNPVSIYWDAENKEYAQTDAPPEKKPGRTKFVLMELTNDDHYNRIGAIFRSEQEFIYGEMVEEIKKIYGVGTNIAKQQIIPYLVGNEFLQANKGVYTPNYKTKKKK